MPLTAARIQQSLKPKNNMFDPTKWVAGRQFDAGFMPTSWSFDPTTYTVSITMTPASGSGMVSQRVPVKPYTNYTVSGNNNGAQLFVYPIAGGTALTSNQTYPFTFNSGSNNELYMCVYKSSNPVNPVTVDHIQMEESSTATTFDFYHLVGGGNAPQKPKKNLIKRFTDPSYPLLNGATPSTDGTSLVFTAPTNVYTAAINQYVIPVKVGTQYTLSGTLTANLSRVRIGRGDTNAFIVEIHYNTLSTTFTAPTDTVLLTLDNNGAANGSATGVGICSFSDIQIEEGSVATAYEPYQLVGDLKTTVRVLTPQR